MIMASSAVPKFYKTKAEQVKTRTIRIEAGKKIYENGWKIEQHDLFMAN